MQKTQIVTYFLIPADQHPSEAVHPAMRAFHYPPPCLEPELVFQRFRFISPRPDMGGKAKLEQQPPYLLIVITFVETHPLGSLGGGIGPLDGDALDGLTRQLEVIAIGPIHCETDGHAAAVGEQAALRADFAAVGRILAHLFPPQAGLWSWRHPSPATPNQCLARRHMPPAPVPTRPRRHWLPSMLGSDDGPHCVSRCRWHPRRPTDSRCAAQRKWHPSLYDHQRGDDDIPKDAVCAGGVMAQCAPTARRAYASHGGRAHGRQASVWLLEERIFLTGYHDHLLLG